MSNQNLYKNNAIIISKPSYSMPKFYRPMKSIKINTPSAVIQTYFDKIINKDYETAKTIFIDNEMSLYTVNDNKETVLHYILRVCSEKNEPEEEILKIINHVENIWNLLSIKNKFNQTPLHLMCMYQLFKVFTEIPGEYQELIDYNIPDSYGRTPYMYALIGKKITEPLSKTILSYLLNNEIDEEKINQYKVKYYTALTTIKNNNTLNEETKTENFEEIKKAINELIEITGKNKFDIPGIGKIYKKTETIKKEGKEKTKISYFLRNVYRNNNTLDYYYYVPEFKLELESKAPIDDNLKDEYNNTINDYKNVNILSNIVSVKEEKDGKPEIKFNKNIQLSDGLNKKVEEEKEKLKEREKKEEFEKKEEKFNKNNKDINNYIYYDALFVPLIDKYLEKYIDNDVCKSINEIIMKQLESDKLSEIKDYDKIDFSIFCKNFNEVEYNSFHIINYVKSILTMMDFYNRKNDDEKNITVGLKDKAYNILLQSLNVIRYLKEENKVLYDQLQSEQLIAFINDMEKNDKINELITGDKYNNIKKTITDLQEIKTKENKIEMLDFIKTDIKDTLKQINNVTLNELIHIQKSKEPSEQQKELIKVLEYIYQYKLQDNLFDEINSRIEVLNKLNTINIQERLAEEENTQLRQKISNILAKLNINIDNLDKQNDTSQNDIITFYSSKIIDTFKYIYKLFKETFNKCNECIKINKDADKGKDKLSNINNVIIQFISLIMNKLNNDIKIYNKNNQVLINNVQNSLIYFKNNAEEKPEQQTQIYRYAAKLFKNNINTITSIIKLYPNVLLSSYSNIVEYINQIQILLNNVLEQNNLTNITSEFKHITKRFNILMEIKSLQVNKSEMYLNINDKDYPNIIDNEYIIYKHLIYIQQLINSENKIEIKEPLTKEDITQNKVNIKNLKLLSDIKYSSSYEYIITKNIELLNENPKDKDESPKDKELNEYFVLSQTFNNYKFINYEKDGDIDINEKYIEEKLKKTVIKNVDETKDIYQQLKQIYLSNQKEEYYLDKNNDEIILEESLNRNVENIYNILNSFKIEFKDEKNTELDKKQYIKYRILEYGVNIYYDLIYEISQYFYELKPENDNNLNKYYRIFDKYKLKEFIEKIKKQVKDLNIYKTYIKYPLSFILGKLYELLYIPREEHDAVVPAPGAPGADADKYLYYNIIDYIKDIEIYINDRLADLTEQQKLNRKCIFIINVIIKLINKKLHLLNNFEPINDGDVNKSTTLFELYKSIKEEYHNKKRFLQQLLFNINIENNQNIVYKVLYILQRIIEIKLENYDILTIPELNKLEINNIADRNRRPAGLNENDYTKFIKEHINEIFNIYKFNIIENNNIKYTGTNTNFGNHPYIPIDNTGIRNNIFDIQDIDITNKTNNKNTNLQNRNHFISDAIPPGGRRKAGSVNIETLFKAIQNKYLFVYIYKKHYENYIHLINMNLNIQNIDNLQEGEPGFKLTGTDDNVNRYYNKDEIPDPADPMFISIPFHGAIPILNVVRTFLLGEPDEPGGYLTVNIKYFEINTPDPIDPAQENHILPSKTYNYLLYNGYVKIDDINHNDSNQDTIQNILNTSIDKLDEYSLLSMDTFFKYNIQKLKYLQYYYDLINNIDLNKKEIETLKQNIINNINTYIKNNDITKMIGIIKNLLNNTIINISIQKIKNDDDQKEKQNKQLTYLYKIKNILSNDHINNQLARIILYYISNTNKIDTNTFDLQNIYQDTMNYIISNDETVFDDVLKYYYNKYIINTNMLYKIFDKENAELSKYLLIIIGLIQLEYNNNYFDSLNIDIPLIKIITGPVPPVAPPAPVYKLLSLDEINNMDINNFNDTNILQIPKLSHLQINELINLIDYDKLKTLKLKIIQILNEFKNSHNPIKNINNLIINLNKDKLKIINLEIIIKQLNEIKNLVAPVIPDDYKFDLHDMLYIISNYEIKMIPNINTITDFKSLFTILPGLTLEQINNTTIEFENYEEDNDAHNDILYMSMLLLNNNQFNILYKKYESKFELSPAFGVLFINLLDIIKQIYTNNTITIFNGITNYNSLTSDKLYYILKSINKYDQINDVKYNNILNIINNQFKLLNNELKYYILKNINDISTIDNNKLAILLKELTINNYVTNKLSDKINNDFIIAKIDILNKLNPYIKQLFIDNISTKGDLTELNNIFKNISYNKFNQNLGIIGNDAFYNKIIIKNNSFDNFIEIIDYINCIQFKLDDIHLLQFNKINSLINKLYYNYNKYSYYSILQSIILSYDFKNDYYIFILSIIILYLYNESLINNKKNNLIISYIQNIYNYIQTNIKDDVFKLKDDDKNEHELTNKIKNNRFIYSIYNINVIINDDDTLKTPQPNKNDLNISKEEVFTIIQNYLNNIENKDIDIYNILIKLSYLYDFTNINIDIFNQFFSQIGKNIFYQSFIDNNNFNVYSYNYNNQLTNKYIKLEDFNYDNECEENFKDKFTLSGGSNLYSIPIQIINKIFDSNINKYQHLLLFNKYDRIKKLILSTNIIRIIVIINLLNNDPQKIKYQKFNHYKKKLMKPLLNRLNNKFDKNVQKDLFYLLDDIYINMSKIIYNIQQSYYFNI